MAETNMAEFNIETAKKSDLIAKAQELGIEVNPSATNEILREAIKGKEKNTQHVTADLSSPTPTPKSDMSEILSGISTIIHKVEGIEKRVNKLENGGVNDFKSEARDQDIVKAAATKEGVNPRIVQIVENTLGVDFGVEVVGNKENPGSLLTILVPQRLSPVAVSYRPIVGSDGQYKKDPKSGRIEEEEYWPGDRRSISLGATDSYDVIQGHCNRVRANILAFYQKMNRPNPEFKTQ